MNNYLRYLIPITAVCSWGVLLPSEGGMIRLESLIELKFLNLSCSGSNLSFRAVRAYPLFEIRRTAPCRAIRGKSSDSRQQYLSQQYPPPSYPQTFSQDAQPWRTMRGPWRRWAKKARSWTSGEEQIGRRGVSGTNCLSTDEISKLSQKPASSYLLGEAKSHPCTCFSVVWCRMQAYRAGMLNKS